MSLVLNHTASIGSAGNSSSKAVSIAVSSGDEIVVIAMVRSNDSFKTVSSVAGGGLTWTKRKAVTEQSSDSWQNLEIWYARATSTTTITVTVTLNAITTSYSAGTGGISLYALAISGTIASPWDANASLPAGAANGTATAVSTNGAPVFLISVEAGTISYAGMPTVALCPTTGFVDASAGGAVSISVATGTSTSALASSTGLTWTGGSFARTVWYGDALVGADDATAATTLTKPTQALTVTEKFPSTIASTLSAPTQAATANTFIPSTIATTLFGPTQALTDTETIPTHIGMTFTGFVGSVPLAIGDIQSAFSNANATSQDLTLSVSAGDEIVLLVCSRSNDSAKTVSTVSGGGLTWTRRTSTTEFSSDSYTVAESWYARATTTGSVTATVTLTGVTTSYSGGLGGIGLFGLVVSGVTIGVWDGSASFPNMTPETGGVLVSTTGSPTVLISCEIGSSSYEFALGLPPSGSTAHFAGNTVGGAINFSVATQILDLPETNASNAEWALGGIGGGQARTIWYADALAGTHATISAAVTQSIPVTIDMTLSGVTQALTAAESMPSTIAMTLSAFSQALTATESMPSTIAMTLAAFSQEIDVVESIPTTIDMTLPALSQEIDIVESIPTTIDMTLAPLSQEIIVAEDFPATIDMTLAALSQEIVVVEEIPTTIGMTLSGFVQELDVIESEIDFIAQTLPGFMQELDVTVGSGAAAIVTTITVTLHGFTQRLRVVGPARRPLKPGDSGIDKPWATRDPPIHQGEIDFFRQKVYARNVDAMVPPPLIANRNLTTQHSPLPRPVVDRRPRGK